MFGLVFFLVLVHALLYMNEWMNEWMENKGGKKTETDDWCLGLD